MAFSQIPTAVTILNSGQIGYIGISLTNFTTSAASNIASGSGIEIAGAWFKADSDIVPNASSWTAITTATTTYLALTPSGTAGSQIITASWLSYAPTWDTAKQGWYSSAASNIRVVASAYKNSNTSYLGKQLLSNRQTNNLYSDILPIGTILMFDGTGWVDNSTIPNWYACIAANAGVGCPNLVDRFILGKVVAGSGATGGANTHTISIGEMPSHSHGVPTAPSGGGTTLTLAKTTVGNATSYTELYTDGRGSGTVIDMHPAYYSVIYIRKCY
jgi:microcystin-dependent protein